MELMRWTALVEEYGKELREGSLDSPATDVFGCTEEGEKRWKDLKNRVVEHVSMAHPLQISYVRYVWTKNAFCLPYFCYRGIFHVGKQQISCIFHYVLFFNCWYVHSIDTHLARKKSILCSYFKDLAFTFQ